MKGNLLLIHQPAERIDKENVFDFVADERICKNSNNLMIDGDILSKNDLFVEKQKDFNIVPIHSGSWLNL